LRGRLGLGHGVRKREHHCTSHDLQVLAHRWTLLVDYPRSTPTVRSCLIQ
jgi:hypothetical protein